MTTPGHNYEGWNDPIEPTTRYITGADGVYEVPVSERGRRGLTLFTLYCSMPDSPRGQYDEEIDVRTRNAREARRVGAAVIADHYDRGLAVRRVVRRVEGVMYL